MRYTRWPVSAAFVGLLASAGCESLDRPIVSPELDEAVQTARAPERQGFRTLDDEFARVAREEVPGFAGYYLQPDGTPVVRLVHPGQRGAAARYLARQVPEGGRGPQAGIARRPVFRDATYDFAQLKAWADRLDGLLAREDVYMLDVDEVENRVFMGVRDAAAIGAVRAAAAGLGIPAAALHVETQPAPERRISVRDRTSTLQGGYQIAFSGGACTLGFNAVFGGKSVFVTNSHCTSTYFGSDGSTIYQATVASGNAVGTEIADRGLYACVSGSSSCRRSDAAVIQHNGTRTVDRGGIARTDWNTGGPGGLTVTGVYDVVARYAGSTPVGTWLDKTGRTSGTTYGQVTQSCVSIGNLRCQDVSKVWSEPGDSGSPILVWKGGNSAELQGILWGGPNGDWTTTYSSRLGGIEYDLGALSSLCRSAYGC